MHASRWLCAALLILPISVFARGRVSGYCQQGGQVTVTGGVQSATKIQQSYPQCSLSVHYSSNAGGFVNTSGTAVTWISGTLFNANSGWPTLQITINGTPYTISTVNSTTSITLTGSAGTQNGVAYAMPPTAPAAIFSDNNGTPLANPFTSTNTGFWAFYADNRAYDITANGGGIPAPFTWGAVQIIEAQDIPTQFSDNLIPSKYANFSALCMAATASATKSPITLGNVQPTGPFTCPAPIQINSGGVIQALASASVSNPLYITGPFQVGRYKVFDLSLATVGAIQFAGGIQSGAPVGGAPICFPEWFGSTIGTSGSADNLSGGFSGCQNALPWRSTNAQNLRTVAGQISLQNTGVDSAYTTAVPLWLSSAVALAGTYPFASQIYAVAGFNSGMADCMIDMIDANGSGASANTNFFTVISDLQLSANANSNINVCGISWAASIGSSLKRLSINTAAIGVIVGGSSTSTSSPDADNTSAEDLTFGLQGVNAQAMVFASGAVQATTNFVAHNVKSVVFGSAPSGVSNLADFDIGHGWQSVHFDSLNVEQRKWPILIRFGTTDISFTGVVAYSDCSTTCGSPYNRIALISPTAANTKVQGVQYGYTMSVVIGNAWLPGGGYSTAVSCQGSLSAGDCLIDPANHLQQNTVASCTAGLTQPMWNDSGGTISDGTCTWQDLSLIGICGINGMTENCAVPVVAINGFQTKYQPGTGLLGAQNSTDTNLYSFCYNSQGGCNPVPLRNMATVLLDLHSASNQSINLTLTPGYTKQVVRHVTISNCTTGASVAHGKITINNNAGAAQVVADAGGGMFNLAQTYYFSDLIVAAGFTSGGSVLSSSNGPLLYVPAAEETGAASCQLTITGDVYP